jgi:hypothetical protein
LRAVRPADLHGSRLPATETGPCSHC